MSDLEEAFAFQLRALSIPHERQYKFHSERRWKADFAFPEHRLLVEIEGAVWINGRHNRGSGFVKDLEKYNAAAMEGWTLLRFHGASVKSGEAVEMVRRFINE